MPGPDPRAAVRVAAFERSLDAFNDEQGRKVALSIAVALAQYHEQYVAPLLVREAEHTQWLEARIYALETPAWKRWLTAWKEGRLRRAEKRHAADLAAAAAAVDSEQRSIPR